MLHHARDACPEIESAPENPELPDIDRAVNSLIQALADHAAGTPEQALAWEAGLAGIPQAFRQHLPALARLNQLARKAWPEVEG